MPRSCPPLRLADQLTVLLITYNEESNIARTLEAVAWAKAILVVDSGSTDTTRAIISRFPQASIVERPFDTFATQCNFGLSKISTEWVLSLDADYELTTELSQEIKALAPPLDVTGFTVNFTYCIYGRPLRATLYPPRCVLYRRVKARYRDEGHGHRVTVDGRKAQLLGRIRHDDRKPLARWFDSQQRYARVEADHLLSATAGDLGGSDRIRLKGWLAPLVVFAYTLFCKRCILEGWPGWLYVLQRTLAEIILAIEIVDRRLRGSRATGP
jgi:glycosyltransferase involved in cell wall biosynthesis